jgi:hypothetical protein
MQKLIYNATQDRLDTFDAPSIITKPIPGWREVESDAVWKIVINGRVVDSGPKVFNYTDSGYGVKCFFEHIRNALTNPDTFIFDGCNGKEGSVKWLEHHRVRLHLTNWNHNLFLVDPQNKIESVINRSQTKPSITDALKLAEDALNVALENLRGEGNSRTSTGKARAQCIDALQIIARCK